MASPATGDAGQWARYEFADQPPIPGLSHVVMALPAGEAGETWWRLEAHTDSVRLFTVDMQVGSLEFLYPGGLAVPVERYILTPADGRPREYVDAATDDALLPKIGFFRHLLPRASRPADPEMPFFTRGAWLGQPLVRTQTGAGTPPVDLDGLRRLALDGEVLIGNSRDFRDDRKGRLYEPTPDWNREGPDYARIEFDRDDYREMMAAGFNIFRVRSRHLDWIIDEPVWFLIRDGFDQYRDALFRPNFFGAVMYMDEPAIRAMAFVGMFRHLDEPSKAAETVLELTRGRYHGDGGYGRGNLQRLLERDGWDLGEMVVIQPDYPIWETVGSAVWYELEAGAAGWLMEMRYQPQWFAGLARDQLGVDFPASADANVRFYQAFFTGAARRFGARWGVAIYGQMDLEAARLAFPIAYDAGATYFWFWTSDHAHHVPFDEQLDHARALRSYVAENPRPAKVKGPATAIALPWGYLLDHYQLKPTFDETFSGGRLWWSEEMELTDDNGHGTTYGGVLAAGAAQAAELLRAGEPFDFIYLRRGERPPAIYEQVRRVLETGEVVVEGTSAP